MSHHDDDHIKREVLKHHVPELKKVLKVNNIADQLHRMKLSDGEIEQIKSKLRNDGNTCAIESLLLDHVMYRIKEYWDTFLDILRRCDYENEADMLEHDHLQRVHRRTGHGKDHKSSDEQSIRKRQVVSPSDQPGNNQNKQLVVDQAEKLAYVNVQQQVIDEPLTQPITANLSSGDVASTIPTKSTGRTPNMQPVEDSETVSEAVHVYGNNLDMSDASCKVSPETKNIFDTSNSDNVGQLPSANNPNQNCNNNNPALDIDNMKGHLNDQFGKVPEDGDPEPSSIDSISRESSGADSNWYSGSVATFDQLQQAQEETERLLEDSCTKQQDGCDTVDESDSKEVGTASSPTVERGEKRYVFRGGQIEMMNLYQMSSRDNASDETELGVQRQDGSDQYGHDQMIPTPVEELENGPQSFGFSYNEPSEQLVQAGAPNLVSEQSPVEETLATNVSASKYVISERKRCVSFEEDSVESTTGGDKETKNGLVDYILENIKELVPLLAGTLAIIAMVAMYRK